MRRWLIMLIILGVIATCPMQVLAEPSTGHTPLDLEIVLDTLRSGVWTNSYELGEFDCSNMSALLDFTLDTLGYESYILAGNTYRLVGETPVLSGRHAMLMVFCDSYNGTGKCIEFVEATALRSFVLRKDASVIPLYNGDYFIPDMVFATAQQAYEAMPWEFTWTIEDVHKVFDTIKQ